MVFDNDVVLPAEEVATGDGSAASTAPTGAFASLPERGTMENTLLKPAPRTVPTIKAVASQPGIKPFFTRRASGKMGLSSLSRNFTRRAVNMGPGSVVRGAESLWRILRSGTAGRMGRPAKGW